MKLTVLGVSPACPNPGGASAGYLLESAGFHLLIDCGHGIAAKVQEHLPIGEIDAIVISHMHADHTFDLEPLNYGVRFTASPRIPLYLPPNGRGALQRLRTALDLEHNFWETSYILREYDPALPLTLGPFTIQFTPTVHFIPAHAMRIIQVDTGAVLVYSSDTGPSPAVEALLHGAHTAVVEATYIAYPDGQAFHGHLTGSLAAEMARRSGVQHLLLTHYWHTVAAEILAEARRVFGPNVSLAKPGTVYHI